MLLISLLASAVLGYCYGKTGQNDKSREVLRKLEQLSKNNPVSSQEKAIIYAGLGEMDKVYENLRAACSEKFPAFPYIISDPLLEEIHSDTRFNDVKQCARL